MSMDQETDDQKAQRLQIVEAFATIIKEKRKDAIEGRRASGIEKEWQEDTDHYEGFDEVNHGSSSGMTKARNPSGGLTEPSPNVATRSTVFLKITRPYCDAAAARMGDMLLPTDDRNWALRATPRPDLVKLASTLQQPVMPPQAPATGLRGVMSRMFPSTQQQQPQQQAVAVQAQQAIDQARQSAELAQIQIDDWLIDCRYHAEVRKVIESASKIGAGILKGPQPAKVKSRAVLKTPDGWALEIKEEILPQSKEVNPWKFYPDRNCGEDIQNGDYVFEEDDITASKLIDLKGTAGYIDEMIDMCLEEGPTNPLDGTRKKKQGEKVSNSDLFQIWYFHGQVSRKEIEAAGCKCEDKDMYPCVVSMVNDRIIKITLSPLDSGEFPYDVMVWQKREGSWAGVGVSRQMRECQKGANAAVRNLMDNAGLGAGPQIVVDRTKIVPANGRWELVPRKVWYTKSGEENINVHEAFQMVIIPTLQQELMAILQFWLKEAEDVTGLPMLLQGQQGSAPETVGGMSMLHNNSTTVLRRIARTFDDRITEPHISRYYEFLLLHGPDDAKGDFKIDARGSSALIERDIQGQQLMQMVGLSLNPAYGMDPVSVITEVLKSMRLDPKRLELSDERKKEIASQQPPPPIQLQVEQIKGQNAMQLQQAKGQQVLQATQMEMQHEEQMLQSGGATPHAANAMARIESTRIRAESDQAIQASRALAEQSYANTEAQIARDNAAARHQEIMDKRELAILEYSLKNNQTLTQVKADLAKTAMQEQTKRELAGVDVALTRSEGMDQRTHDMNKHMATVANDPAMQQAEQQASEVAP